MGLTQRELTKLTRTELQDFIIKQNRVVNELKEGIDYLNTWATLLRCILMVFGGILLIGSLFFDLFAGWLHGSKDLSFHFAQGFGALQYIGTFLGAGIIFTIVFLRKE